MSIIRRTAWAGQGRDGCSIKKPARQSPDGYADITEKPASGAPTGGPSCGVSVDQPRLLLLGIQCPCATCKPTRPRYPPCLHVLLAIELGKCCSWEPLHLCVWPKCRKIACEGPQRQDNEDEGDIHPEYHMIQGGHDRRYWNKTKSDLAPKATPELEN